MSTSHTSYGWQTGANRVMLLSDDRNLPMPLQKTQISTISFGHSVGTGRTGVRPAPDVPRGCPPHSFLRQEGPANPSAANFPQSAVLRLLPTRETLAQQYACWRRRIPLRDGAQCDRAYVATGAYIRSCELSGVVERAHSNVARKTKGWLEHEIHHAAETREA